MVEKIISGGQTGADFGGLVGARACGLQTGGTAPLRYRTERGHNPLLAAFGLVESPSSGYVARTEQNVRDSDGTVILGDLTSPGCRTTLQFARQYGRPVCKNPTPEELVAFVYRHHIRVLNVAGNRESVSPGIQHRTRDLIILAFGSPHILR